MAEHDHDLGFDASMLEGSNSCGVMVDRSTFPRRTGVVHVILDHDSVTNSVYVGIFAETPLELVRSSKCGIWVGSIQSFTKHMKDFVFLYLAFG